MFDLKKLQQMQKEMQEQIGRVQDEVAQRTVEATSGGGAVTVVISGSQEIRSIKIKPEAVDPGDLEMLEDLMMAAVNAAIEKSKALQESEMSKVAGGLLPPGMNFPF